MVAIAAKEGLQLDNNAAEILVEQMGNDIRQVINCLQVYTLYYAYYTILYYTTLYISYSLLLIFTLFTFIFLLIYCRFPLYFPLYFRLNLPLFFSYFGWCCVSVDVACPE